MTGAPGPGGDEGGERLREEAALWFARMRGPDGDAHRAEFGRWLAQGASHRVAYGRVAQVFSDAKLLKRSARSRRARHRVGAGAALAGAFALILASGLRPMKEGGRLGAGTDGVAAASLRTGPDLRRLRLADGSMLTLAPETVVTVAFTDRTRSLTLGSGRARFEVAHGRRPFRVLAGSSVVVAHGTLFEVTLEGGRVRVALLRGSVGVLSRAPDRSRGGGEYVLRPGQVLSAGGGAERPVLSRLLASDLAGPLQTFEGVRMADLVAAANRRSGGRLVLDGEALDDLRVSGSFGIDDPATLAGRLAALFDLSLHAEGGRLVLRDRRKIGSHP